MKTYDHEPSCQCDDCRQYWGEPSNRAHGAARSDADAVRVQRVDGQQASDRECPRCNGRGEVKEIGYHDLREWWTCMRCCGTGRVQADASLLPIDRISDGQTTNNA